MPVTQVVKLVVLVLLVAMRVVMLVKRGLGVAMRRASLTLKALVLKKK